MIFETLKRSSDDLRRLMHETTDRDLILLVSVPEPDGDEDELHFTKLVMWSYVFVMESASPSLKHLPGLLRISRPEQARDASSAIEHVINLRTARAHNLLFENKADRRKLEQASIWVLENGGDPIDYKRCCRALCTEMDRLVKSII